LGKNILNIKKKSEDGIKMKLFEKGELRLLWPFYVEAGIATALYVLIPFMIIYFSSLGFNSFQIGILVAIWPLASLIFEIPTGTIADLYGRKFSVIVGWTLAGLIFFIVPLSGNFYYLCLMLFLFGAAITLSSGSYDAWVVDLLRAKKMKNRVAKYFSTRVSLVNFAFLLSGLIGAFGVAKFGISSIWYLSGASFLLSVIVLYFGEEVFKKHKFSFRKSLRQTWNQSKKSLAHGYRHHVIYYLLIIAFITGIVNTLDSFISWTPFLEGFGFPDYAFGYLWSFIGLVGIVTPFIAGRLAKNNRERRVLITISILTVVYGLVILISGNIYFALFAILLGSAIMDAEIPISSIYFHRFVPGRIRATLGSMQNMFSSLAGIIAYPIAGLLIMIIGARYTLVIASLLAIPSIILYLKIRENRKEKKQHLKSLER
jgi:MFS family permease